MRDVDDLRYAVVVDIKMATETDDGDVVLQGLRVVARVEIDLIRRNSY